MNIMTQRKSIKKRRQQSKKEIIEDIIQIAREMMQSGGVGALSFNGIARELGIKPPSLYTYFDSKNAIYDAIFRRGFHLLDETIQQADGNTFDERLESIFRAYMTFARQNPDMFQIMFQRPIPDFVPSDESMAVSLQSLANAQSEIRTLFEDEGIDPAIPPEQALDILISMMHGLATMHLANHSELPVGEGRFGDIIAHSVNVFSKAWKKT